MIVVFKYPLIISDVQTVWMPAWAELLSVQAQNGVLGLWARVDTDSSPTMREVRMVGTGHPLPAATVESQERFAGKYISTVQTAEGSLVWHFFDMGVVQ